MDARQMKTSPIILSNIHPLFILTALGSSPSSVEHYLDDGNARAGCEEVVQRWWPCLPSSPPPSGFPSFASLPSSAQTLVASPQQLFIWRASHVQANLKLEVFRQRQIFFEITFVAGWFNLSQVHSRLLTAAASRVYSMATPDAAPSIVVYVTVPNKETGTKLAHSIIENKLAACVNQIPGVESTYWWEGKVETDTEILLMIKTRQALLGELTDHVNNNHPYDTPEVIALPITGGSEKYLKWIGDNTKRAELA
ncbi:uncharacterized protein [Physcomitrium patens]|uniref:uncharacterized protein isoform X4 n=1 Tax=Physcomitrium patens TaxID=3218 RepID=UPI00024B0DBF